MAMDPSNLLGIGPVEGTTASTLEGDLAADSASPRAGLLTWEHQGSYHLSKTEMSGSMTSPAPADSMEFETLS